MASKKQSDHCDEKKFKKCFSSLIDYKTSGSSLTFFHPDFDIFDYENIDKNTITISKGSIEFIEFLYNLLNLCGSSEFISKYHPTNETYLDSLFLNNLGWIAEEICKRVKEEGKQLPHRYEVLIKINNKKIVDIDSSFDEHQFAQLAYRVANNAGNMDMVEKLYQISGTEKLSNKLKKENSQTYSPEVNYIHEPYWSYNLFQLRDYGYRIVGTLKPYFVENSKIIKEKNKTFIKFADASVMVRKVPFGYVLPNVYLKKLLEDSKNEELGVAKIFIVPKENNIMFTFKIPNTLTSYQGLNPLIIESNSFDVYQEYITGEGIRGDRSFQKFGHSDFNAVQIIKSTKDGKNYLIDTKELKNFFTPIFDPYIQSYPSLELNYNNFKSWQWKNEKIVGEAKSLNFDYRITDIDITVKLEH